MRRFYSIFVLLLVVVVDLTALSDINNQWIFSKDKSFQSLEYVDIPHTWNNTDMQSGPEFYQGKGYYRKKVDIEADDINKRVFLKFNGVGQHTKLFVNNQKAGSHNGGYSSFTIEVTDYVKQGENNLLVEVSNTSDKKTIPINHNLFGVFGGIYRDIELIIKPKICISPLDYGSNGIYFSQLEKKGNCYKYQVKTVIDNQYKESRSIELQIDLIDDIGVFSTIRKKANIESGGLTNVLAELEVVDPILWQGKYNPYLYNLRVKLYEDGILIDTVNDKVGIRNFEVSSENGFILNGDKYRLYGVARHQDRENKGSALSYNEHLEDMLLIDEIGATSVRLAHYQQAKDVYSICDSLGLVVWAEIPFVNALSEFETQNAEQQLKELIKQNYNHPSICFWGLFNEIPAEHHISYSQQVVDNLVKICRDLDLNRLTTSASASGDIDNPIHWKTDLQAFNRYHGWYGGDVKGFSEELDRLHKEVPHQAIGISEYGAGANIHHHSLDSNKPDPIGPFFPENYQAYFHEGHWEQIAIRPYLWATYVWNMFDFACPTIDRGSRKGINHKGLVTYDRKIKKDAFYFYKANWSKEAVLHIVDKRFMEVKTNIISQKVYSNIGEPILLLVLLGYLNHYWSSFGNLLLHLYKIQNLLKEHCCKDQYKSLVQ
jgi:beta-galactosidase